MKDRSRFILLAVAPMLLIPVMVVLISFIVIEAEKEKLESSLSRMEQNNIEIMKLTIQSKVNSIVDLAAYRKSVIKEDLHHRIQQRVEDAHQISLKLYEHYGSTKSEEEVKSLIIEALRPLIWNNGESFIWILDFEGVFKLAPAYLKHLEGTSIIDFKDATGREVIKEEIALTKTGGEGFLWDTFTRPNTGSDEQFDQLAFVKSVGFYNWYMGSGEFLDIATKLADRRLLSEISQLSHRGRNYFFIMDSKGSLLLNSARPEWVGLNYKDSDNVDIATLYNKMWQTANGLQNKEFIEYKWLNPNQDAIESKLSYVQRIPGSDWVIGSGFYPDDIVRGLQYKVFESAKLNQVKLDQLLNTAFWSFIISIGVSFLLSFWVYRLLWRYRTEVNEKNDALSLLNNQLEEKVLKRTEALSEINDDLEMLARTDCLTGVDNRFSFMKIIEGEVRRSKRFDECFSLVLLDIDNFKKINDQYGHDIGDLVLIELSKMAKRLLRDVDSFCRFGGEEFIIVLPKTEVELACKTAERLCLAIAQHKFDVIENVTISLGVGEFQAEMTIDEIIKKVDIALYQAKRTGKNRVCCAKN